MDYYVTGLSSEDRERRLVSLYALKNAGQPSTLPNILVLAKDDEDMDLIEVAVDAMSQFDAQYFTEEVSLNWNCHGLTFPSVLHPTNSHEQAQNLLKLGYFAVVYPSSSYLWARWITLCPKTHIDYLVSTAESQKGVITIQYITEVLWYIGVFTRLSSWEPGWNPTITWHFCPSARQFIYIAALDPGV